MTAEILHVSERTVEDTWAEWQRSEGIKSPKPGNTSNHAELWDEDNTEIVNREIRSYLRKCHLAKEHVRCPQIVRHLIHEGFLCEAANDKEEQAHIHRIQRLMKKRGYVSGAKKNAWGFDEKMKMLYLRANYMQTLEKNAQAEEDDGIRYQRCFMDESYIHHHHQVEETIYDPLDKKIYIQGHGTRARDGASLLQYWSPSNTLQLMAEWNMTRVVC